MIAPLRRAAATAAAVTVAAMLLAGSSASSAATQSPGKATATSATAPSLAVGVNLYVTQNYSLAQARALGQRDIRYIARTLRLHAIAIAWDYDIRGLHANQVRPAKQLTPSVADIAALTDIARSYGLKVEYRILFAINGSNARSESIRPAYFKVWLQSLLKTETPVLQLAQREHVSEFVAGTEMASVDGNPQWGTFFGWARRLYRGALSYATWGGRPGVGGYFSSPGWGLPPVKYYGVTAYPSIRLPASASVARLTSAWLAFLRHEPGSVLRRTAIDEIGIPAVAGAYLDPWQWGGLKGPADDQIQARWFDAVCRAAGAEHMRGIYFWSADLIDDPAHPFPSLVKFEARSASETAIRTCAQQAAVAAR